MIDGHSRHEATLPAIVAERIVELFRCCRYVLVVGCDDALFAKPLSDPILTLLVLLDFLEDDVRWFESILLPLSEALEHPVEDAREFFAQRLFEVGIDLIVSDSGVTWDTDEPSPDAEVCARDAGSVVPDEK